MKVALKSFTALVDEVHDDDDDDDHDNDNDDNDDSTRCDMVFAFYNSKVSD